MNYLDRSDLANRMKGYERASERYLPRRMPLLLRFDGCHFHSFTRNFKRPFDEVLIKSMQETAKYLCQNIETAQIAYVQSDEITLLLVNYKHLDTAAWFNNRQNKIESVAASMCTYAFNKFFRINAEEFMQNCALDYETQGLYGEGTIEYKLCEAYQKAIDKGATFDCRAFVLPKEEVTNNFYWRQLDCSRNSVQMVGQAHFSHDELNEKTCNMVQDMLFTQKGINWNDFPVYQKRGSCVIRNESTSNGVSKGHWFIDKNIPIFKGEGREYIDRLVMVGE